MQPVRSVGSCSQGYIARTSAACCSWHPAGLSSSAQLSSAAHQPPACASVARTPTASALLLSSTARSQPQQPAAPSAHLGEAHGAGLIAGGGVGAQANHHLHEENTSDKRGEGLAAAGRSRQPVDSVRCSTGSSRDAAADTTAQQPRKGPYQPRHTSAHLGVHAGLLEGVAQVLGLGGRLGAPANHADLQGGAAGGGRHAAVGGMLPRSPAATFNLLQM